MPIQVPKSFRKKKTGSIPKRYSINTIEEEGDIGTSKSSDPKKPYAPCKRKPCKKNCDKNGLKSLYSPFSKFVTNKNKATELITIKKMSNNYRPAGLSPKEKSYVICSCQSRTSRYRKLKNLAENAIKSHKIFTVIGVCPPVQRALIERGWVEKITPNKMNLSNLRSASFTERCDLLTELERLLLSNLVERCTPNFIWRTTEEQHDTIDMNTGGTVIINRLKADAQWTSKQGLCSSIKRNYWFYIEDVAEVFAPRTYFSYDINDIEGFVKDYKITACTSLLKWVLSMVARKRPIFVESGKISINVIVFALNRCKEYLFRKQNKDIDRGIPDVSARQWTAFIKKYNRIITNDDVFQLDRENKLPLFFGYAKIMLKEIHKYRPQLSCEGCHNIWIIKPAHCSRGRGIRMASKIGLITNLLDKSNAKYVIQKYIEEPLLIHETKFDIRQYYLVTSTYPLVIWMYKDCYLKFSSQRYNLKNFHESIHLTNNAVQKKYKNCAGRHPDLPQNNMWDLEKYKSYLHQIGKSRVWDSIIYPGMKKAIVGIMLSCQDSLSFSKNRFELYGCDFILDKDYKPWLIEINSCPDLKATTNVTGKICPSVVLDIIKVVIDHRNDPKSPTGNFECIYRQAMTMPRYGVATDLIIKGYGLSDDYFFKPNIDLNDSYHDVDIENEADMKNIINKLKNHYDTDYVEESNRTDSDTENNVSIQNTESEYELDVKANIINNQLDRLIDNITFDRNDSIKSFPIPVSFGSLNLSKSSMPATKSVMDIKSLIKTVSRFASMKEIGAQKLFNFSQLDDGHSVKGSCQAFRSLDKEVTMPNNGLNGALHSKKDKDSDVLQATYRMISFFNDRKRELGVYPIPPESNK